MFSANAKGEGALGTITKDVTLGPVDTVLPGTSVRAPVAELTVNTEIAPGVGDIPKPG
jgi:hypothetical protein